MELDVVSGSSLRCSKKWMTVDMRCINVATVFLAYGLAHLSYDTYTKVVVHALATLGFAVVTFPSSNTFADESRIMRSTRTTGLIVLWWSPMAYAMATTADMMITACAVGTIVSVLAGGACLAFWKNTSIRAHDLCHSGLLIANAFVMGFVMRMHAL